MVWFQSKRDKKRRNSDWDFFDGYPPNLRMRRLANGAWEVRQATQEETQEFLASEAAFAAPQKSPSSDLMSPDENLPPAVPSDAKRDRDPGR